MKNRRFAIPAACSIGLHATLILGFSNPSPYIVTTTNNPPKPTEIVRTQEVELPPPLPSEETGDSRELVARPRLGEPRPTQLDLPRDPGPHSIVIEVAPPGPEVTGKFERIGDIGSLWGDKNGTDPFAKIGNIIDARGLDHTPRTRFQPGPGYPTDARKDGLSGEVIVDFVVAETGDVTRVAIVRSTHPVFEEPARRAVARWRFEPGRRDGHIVSFRMRQPISFNINAE